MIISRTPFRVSFVGGGTDMPYFYRAHGGCVLSMSINRYMFLSMHRRFRREGILLKYSQQELVKDANSIKHRIIREVFGMYGVSGVDFSSAADVPAGTGLASSSAFAAGMLTLCDAHFGQSRSQIEIAADACDVELNRLGEPIGKQDQYGCAVGGLKKIEFHEDESVTVSPILLTSKQQSELESSICLIYCGNTRSASEQLVTQQKNVVSSVDLTANLKDMAAQANQLAQDIQTKPEVLGDYLHEGWERKRRLSSTVSNPEIDALYNRVRAAGARGGKLLGAGGGGFLLVHAPGAMDGVLDAVKDHSVEFIKLDTAGTTIVYSDEYNLGQAV